MGRSRANGRTVVVVCVIAGGVLLFLRPAPRSGRGLAEPGGSAQREFVVRPQESCTEEHGPEPRPQVTREDPGAGPTATAGANVQQVAATDIAAPSEPVAAPEAPEAPETPEGCGSR